MPIPSLSSTLKVRTQTAKSKESLAASEPSRLPRPGNSEDHGIPRDPIARNRLPQPKTQIPRGNDEAKRRSFLPQRGEPPSLARGVATDEREGLGDTHHEGNKALKPINTTASTSTAESHRATRSRPNSLYHTGSTSTDLEHGTESSRARGAASKATTSQPAQLSRSKSLQKRNAPAQQAQGSSAYSHSRTQSTSTATANRREPLEPRSRLERPKSLYATSGDRTGSTGHADAGSSEGKGSARSALLSRSVSTRSKPRGTSSADAASATATHGMDQYASSAKVQSCEPAKEGVKRPARPAFSTLQQHFTPRKAGKAPTSTFLHPPPQDAGSRNLSAEMCNVQAQLLQLHLLHKASARTNLEWELSAKRILHQKFDEVAGLYQAMRDNERQEQEQKNIQALREWTGSNSSSSLVEWVQLLSGPLHELPALIDSGGRLHRLAEEFDRWLAWVQDVRSARTASALRPGGFENVETLGDSWKAENASLTRRLTAFARDLDTLTQPNPGSSMGHIVATCKDLLGLVLDELHAMRSIEADIVAREKEWVEARLRAVGSNISELLDGIAVEDGAWRM